MNATQQKLTLSLVLIALLASNVAARAQGTKGSVKKTPTPAADKDNLQLDGPTNDALAAPPADIDVSDEFATQPGSDSVRPIPDLDREAKQLGEQATDALASGATRLRELELKVDRLEKLIEGQSATLQDIADKVGTPADELRAIREELVKLNSKQTVGRPDLGGEQPSLANVGRLVVNNYTGVTYPLSINGQQFLVGPGRGEFNVVYGPVTTEILGYEAPKNWAEADWREVNGQQQLAIQIR